MLKYTKALTNDVLKTRHVYYHANGDREHYFEGVNYLIRDDKILCHGKEVHSYDNKDYEYVDEDNCTNLVRNGKVLYKSKPFYDIDLRCSGTGSIFYQIYDENGDRAGQVFLSFEKSLLSIIDERLKGEQHDEL